MSCNPNLNYNTANWVTLTKQKHLPLKKIKFIKYKHKAHIKKQLDYLRNLAFN